MSQERPAKKLDTSTSITNQQDLQRKRLNDIFPLKLSNTLCKKCHDFFDLMIKGLKINFRYDVESTEIYGSLLDNGIWVGMVGLVHRQVKF